MAKVGGGVNAVHLSNTSHPFGVSGKCVTPKRGRSQATGPSARARKGFISANASSKRQA